jgi:structural maintenance of chromosome 4
VEAIESELKGKTVVFNKVEREAEELLKRMKKLENEDVSLGEKRAFLKKKLANLGKSGAEVEKKRGQVERELSNLQVEKDRLEKQISEMQTNIEQNEQELVKISEGLRGKTETYQRELIRLQAEQAPFQAKVRQAQGECEIAQAALKDYTTLQHADSVEMERVKSDIEEAERELGECRESHAALTSRLKELKKQSVRLLEERQMAESKLEQVVKEIQVVQCTLSEAKEARQSAGSSSHHNQAIAALLKDAKKIGGNIYGRLGDLGMIEAKYDVAVSTAAHQLHFVVVDTTETGQRCVEYLRQNGLGRASFIIMEKIMSNSTTTTNSSRNNAQLPEGVKRLYDLISPKAKMFEAAFAFAVGDTLVADNMELATRVAYDGPRRNRVVTLDGKLIDTSGAMSGGGGRVSRGAMWLKSTTGTGKDSNSRQQQNDADQATVTAEQVAELQALYQQKQEEQRVLKAMISDYNERILAAGKELKAVELDIAKAEQVLIALPNQLVDLESQRSELVSRLQAGKGKGKEELNKLEKRVASSQQLLKEAQLELAPYSERVQSAEQQIMDAGGVKYKVQRAKLDGMREQLGLYESRLNKVIAEITVLSDGVTNEDSASTGRLQREEESLRRELAELDHTQQQNTELAITIKTSLDALQSQLEEQRDTLNELKKTLEQHTKTIAKFRKHEFELKMKREELEREWAESGQGVVKYEQALQVLKLNEFATRYKFLLFTDISNETVGNYRN